MYFVEFVGYNKKEGYHELCGSDSVFEVDGRKTPATIIRDIKSLSFFKHKHKDAIGFRILKGDRLITARKISDIYVI